MSEIAIVKGLGSVNKAVNIVDTNTTHSVSKGIYIGAAGNYDFYMKSAWVSFLNLTAGSVYPFRAIGARLTSGSAAPDVNAITFLYTK